ncbi:pentatricopeptide repeat-containing protein At1g80150, mitochondrial-like [Zingiber officinale]|uniref:pentatricopeptide repeat-containing protein At1g80150, mitochondrial-like n=1 Tax=Zingiber officinale TaxID=94328 RepID=UPI001C4BF9DE|nr:pentatricopeptide repeat-containing protein At1g80150, mitochondrial-like [Zingiber officinale]
MLSLRTVRRICAAIDAASVTCIVAGLSKLRKRSDFSVCAGESGCPDDFPTISACKAAVLNNRPRPKPRLEKETSSTRNCQGPLQNSEPALFKLKKEKDPEKLFHLFKSNATNRLVIENRFAFEDTVSRLAGARRFDLIEHLLEHQKTLPQGRREGFIVRIIMLYGKARMPDHALQTFRQMHLFSCPRTVKSFNAILKVLSQACKYQDAQMLLDECATKYGIALDEISYNITIKLMCEMGDLDSAYLIMVEMEKAGLKADVVTYTTLISAFYKNGRGEIGNGLWNLMVLRGCLPNLATFNVRIQYLINRMRAWQANELIHLMLKGGPKPDEMTYNLIIKGFCMMGEFDMAEKIFYALRRRGCEPNSKIYQTMVHYFCEGGDFDFAFRLCKDSMERNWFPSVGTIDKLLKGLMSISKHQNAKEILKLVEARSSYSSNEVKELENLLTCDSKQQSQ